MDIQSFDEDKNEENSEILKQISERPAISSQKLGLAVFVKR